MKRCPPCLVMSVAALLLVGSCAQPTVTPSVDATPAAEAVPAKGTAPLKERYTITYERDFVPIAGETVTETVTQETTAPVPGDSSAGPVNGLPAGQVPTGQGAPADAGAPPTGSPTVVLDKNHNPVAVQRPRDDCDYFQLPITPTPPRLPEISPEVARDDRKLNLVLVAHIEAVRNHIYNARKLIRGNYKDYMERCHPDKKVVFDYRVQ